MHLMTHIPYLVSNLLSLTSYIDLPTERTQTSFIDPFYKYLLSTYHVLGTILGTEDTIGKKEVKFLPSWNLYFNMEKTNK